MDLLDDRFDLAIRNGRLGNGAGLMARRVAHEHTRVFASPDYIKRHGAPETTAALIDHHAITYARRGRVQVWMLLREGAQAEIVTPPTRLRLDDLNAIADAPVSGYGLAWLPHWLVRTRLQAGLLVPISGLDDPFIGDVNLLWPGAAHLPFRVRVAIDILAAELPKLTHES